MAEYKWQRRERKQKKAKDKMPKHGKAQAQIYADSLAKREKEKEKLLGRIDKMLMKQTPLEDTMGKNLQTIKPQQLAKVTNTTIPQAGQQIKQQQVQNRQVGQNTPQQPQQPPAQRNIQFGPNGADLLPDELKQRLDKFNALPVGQQAHMANMLEKNNPQDYEMAKYLAMSPNPQIQAHAARKLTPADLDATIQPTNPNEDVVSVLASRTQNPSYMRNLTKHASPKVRLNLIKNPNITDLTMSEMYDDNDDQIRNTIVGRSNNQELLHLFISDKNPQIRVRLIDKLDHDGLKILLTDPDPHVSAMAKSKLQGRFSKMEKAADGKKPKRPVFTQQDSDRLDTKMTTVITPQDLPKYGYGTPIGSDSIGGSNPNPPSFSNKSMILKEIGDFVKKGTQLDLPEKEKQLPLPEGDPKHDKETTQFPVRLPSRSHSWHNRSGSYTEFPISPHGLKGIPKTHDPTNLGQPNSQTPFPETMEEQAHSHERMREQDRRYEELGNNRYEPEDDYDQEQHDRMMDEKDRREAEDDDDYTYSEEDSSNLPETHLPGGAIKRGNHVFHKARNIQISDDVDLGLVERFRNEWKSFYRHNPGTGATHYGDKDTGRGEASVSILDGVLGGYSWQQQRKAQDPDWEPSEDSDKFMFVTSKRGRHKKLEGAMRYRFHTDHRSTEYAHIDFLSSSPRNEKGMPNRLTGTGKRLIYKLSRQLIKDYEGNGSQGGPPYINLMYLQGARPFYENVIGFQNIDGDFRLTYDRMKKFIKNIRKDDKKGSPFFKKDADDWDNWFDDEDEPSGDIARDPLKKDKIMKDFGAVGDVSVPTYGGTEGQDYKKRVGSALKFKSRGVEGVFDVMKSVKFEDADE